MAEWMGRLAKIFLVNGKGIGMVFSSLLFLFRFLPLVLILYFALPTRFRNLVLFVSSLFFYAWGEPIYVFLMLTSITVDYHAGRRISHFLQEGSRKKARGWLLVSVCYNLGVLGFFKYADFLIGTCNGIFGTQIAPTNIPLPIGISFFTFQTMSYTIDVYRQVTRAQESWVKYGTYVSLFPQLIAGPIVQYKTIAKELEGRKETGGDFAYGIHRFVIGMGKKVLLANNIGILWDTVSEMPAATLPAATAWLGVLAYAFQIYFDFSGYSDMAIGLGRMFGFRFLENFHYPYISASITEFWRRWHISLGSWFREYVYIPLGGNRKGVCRQIRNIAIVWMLTGIWHGANWNFVLWGVYYGALLILEKFVFGKWLARLPRACGYLYTLFFVALGWVLFAFDDLGAGLAYLGAMFGGHGLADKTTAYLLLNYGILLAANGIGSTEIPAKACRVLGGRLGARPWASAALCVAFYVGVTLLCVAYLVDASYNPFLYFRF